MKADLHAHSTASDGVLDSEALCARAAAAGVELFCITDHDTLPLPVPPAVPDSLRLVRGIELTALWRGRVVHILGLNLDAAGNGELAAGVKAQRERREERAQAIAGKLEKRGIEGALEGARRLAGGGSLGRPHFARFLVEQGRAKTLNDAFRRYLGDHHLGGTAPQWTSCDEVVRWILEDGGTPVLAHPAKYPFTHAKLRELVADFITAGGRGLEVACGIQSPNTTRDLAQLCRKHQLLASVGSDFHGGPGDHARLGQPGYLPLDLTPVWAAWQ